jgi:hypothetical protein
MNFYSLDGSKLEDKQIYERFDINQNYSSSLDDNINQNDDDDNEQFSSIPTTKSNATDNNYQCSDGFSVKGNNLGNEIKNNSLIDCKNKCVELGSDCIGFNFDTSKNICTLKKNASSLINDAMTSTLCIKKSAGNKNCKVNNNTINSTNSVKAFNDLDSIFKNDKNLNQKNLASISPELINSMSPELINSISPELINSMGSNSMGSNSMGSNSMGSNSMGSNSMGSNSMGSNPMDSKDTKLNYPMNIPSVNTISNIPLESVMETETNNIKNNMENNMENNYQGVYVDLDCFMKNINVLQHHTDNMMIDLSLLLSNIKSCSYVKKNNITTKLSNDKMNSNELINQITSKINIPKPDIVKLKNIKADLLIANNVNSGKGQVLEVTKEPFTSNYDNNYNNIYLIVVIFIIIFIIYYLYKQTPR